MKTTKKVILETLNEIDNVQAEKVLDYIKSLLGRSTFSNNRQLKQDALKQIRKALSKDQGLEFYL